MITFVYLVRHYKSNGTTGLRYTRPAGQDHRHRTKPRATRNDANRAKLSIRDNESDQESKCKLFVVMKVRAQRDTLV